MNLLCINLFTSGKRIVVVKEKKSLVISVKLAHPPSSQIILDRNSFGIIDPWLKGKENLLSDTFLTTRQQCSSLIKDSMFLCWF